MFIWAAGGLGLLEISCSYRKTPRLATANADPPRANMLSGLEGHLVQQSGNTPADSAIYLIEGGQKRWVRSPSWLWLHDYTSKDVILLPPKDMAAIRQGDDIN